MCVFSGFNEANLINEPLIYIKNFHKQVYFEWLNFYEIAKWTINEELFVLKIIIWMNISLFFSSTISISKSLVNPTRVLNRAFPELVKCFYVNHFIFCFEIKNWILLLFFFFFFWSIFFIWIFHFTSIDENKFILL